VLFVVDDRQSRKHAQSLRQRRQAA
jgi:hypothetical protein